MIRMDPALKWWGNEFKLRNNIIVVGYDKKKRANRKEISHWKMLKLSVTKIVSFG